MADLACKTKDAGFQLEQVQDFTPTPMTVATVIYYSGYDPYTLKKSQRREVNAKKDQHRFFFVISEKTPIGFDTLHRLKRPDLLEKLLEKNPRRARKMAARGSGPSENTARGLSGDRYERAASDTSPRGVELVDVEVGDPSPMQVQVEGAARICSWDIQTSKLAVKPRSPLRRDMKALAM